VEAGAEDHTRIDPERNIACPEVDLEGSGGDPERADLERLLFGEILPVAIPQPIAVGQVKLGMYAKEGSESHFRWTEKKEVGVIAFGPDPEETVEVNDRQR
jgi:hypothetical protein